VASKNGTGIGELSVKLNQLEDKVSKLNEQIKTNKQTISELKLVIAQRDEHILDLEARLAYAQRSLIEKATQKIEECRSLIKTGMDENIIHPAVAQIQQQVKTAQTFVDETLALLLEKKAQLDNAILSTKDKVVQCPRQAKTYLEKSLLTPSQTFVKQTLDNLNAQANTTKALIEDKVLYPGKVMLDVYVRIAENLPDKALVLLDTQIIGPANHAYRKASTVTQSIYPNTLALYEKTSGRLVDTLKQSQAEIAHKIKKSPFWDGKNKAAGG
jgi:hypothetical protein